MAIKITQEESIELQKALIPLVMKYGETEVRYEVEYIINWCNEDTLERSMIDKQLEAERKK